MTQVSRKGFVDKNGKQVVIVPPKEEYAGADIFQESDAIDTILSEGVHHISYKRDGKRHPTQHILVVTRDYGKTGPIAPTREIVYQLLIDDFGGIMKRYRKFTDTELLEPDGDWTEWVSMIPTVDSTITEDGDKPVSGAAIYAALAGKMGALKEIFIDCDDSGSADAWEIRPDAAGEAAFRAALIWGNNAPRLVIVNITKGTDGTTNHKTYRTIGSIHATAVEVNVDSYDLTAEIYVDGHVFTRTGEEFNQEQTWGQGLTLASNDIFTHVSNS